MPYTVVNHPSVEYKLSLLRPDSSPAVTRQLIAEISSIVAVEMVAAYFTTAEDSSKKATSALGEPFTPIKYLPARYSLVPVLRSGLGMVPSFQSVLPGGDDAPVFHLGIFRDKWSLQPVEYYNNLPQIKTDSDAFDAAIVLDPIVATGGTAAAVVTMLKEWKAKKIIFCAVIASQEGIDKIMAEHPDVEIVVAKIDPKLSDKGYIVPGVGDVGDRLHNTH